jgi:hypothetical protein
MGPYPPNPPQAQQRPPPQINCAASCRPARIYTAESDDEDGNSDNDESGGGEAAAGGGKAGQSNEHPQGYSGGKLPAVLRIVQAMCPDSLQHAN